MQTLSQIRQLLAERGLRPKHRLGQNFLHDKNQILKLVEAAQLQAGDIVLEVGPGTGTLTEALLEHGAVVIACELDAELSALLQERVTHSSFQLIRGDALEKNRRLNPAIVQAIGDRPFKLVANLPYQIASTLISTLLTEHAPPHCLGQFVTIQKEVADRLLAQPSTKEYGSLGVIVQSLADVQRIGTLGPSCFWPQPEVTSAMVAIVPKPADELSQLSSDEKRAFARFVTELFSKRRKQLGGIFGREQPSWPSLQADWRISPEMRPEALDPKQIQALWRVMDDRAQSAS